MVREVLQASTRHRGTATTKVQMDDKVASKPLLRSCRVGRMRAKLLTSRGCCNSVLTPAGRWLQDTKFLFGLSQLKQAAQAWIQQMATAAQSSKVMDTVTRATLHIVS
jgi:hypothetical protein